MSSETDAPGVDAERCLDSLAAVLRTCGRFALDTREHTANDVAALFEAWARHLLLATPPPGADGAANDGKTKEWTALDRFVGDVRRDEHEYVVESFKDLRQVIWIFIETFGRSMQADQKSDARVMNQLDRLRESVQGNDAAELKSEALRCASIIEGAITVRDTRYKSHIAKLSDSLEAMAAELVDSREKGAIDALTGVYNRAALEEHMQTMVNFGRFVTDAAVVFMIDIDHFKWINDRFGHPTGDDVLRRVGRGLQRSLRRKEDFIARFGGDEFVAIVNGGADRQIAETADRMSFAIREVEVQVDGETVRVSASIGAARMESTDDVKSWLKRADDAMYRAKQAGRDRIEIDAHQPESGRASDKPQTDSSD